MWACGLAESPRGHRAGLAWESLGRLWFVLVGGAAGGALTGMIRFSGAVLFQ
jgi:hypothetical protein